MCSVRLIYINGPSSSGKTTLAKALQEELDTFFLHIGIDKMIGMMPSKTNDWEGNPAPMGFSWKKINTAEPPLFSIQSGPYAKKISTLLRSLVSTFLLEGHCVIVDDVCSDEKELTLWRDSLSKVCKPHEMLWIELFADNSILDKRELVRGDRMIGSSLEQAQRFEKQRLASDLRLNSSCLSVHQEVQEVKCILKERDMTFNNQSHATVEFLYKIVSKEDWQASQGLTHLLLPSFDDEFIHLATQEQLPGVIRKFWADSKGFFVLKVAYKELIGRCVLESNPGGTNKYYHLYDGAIPLSSIKGFTYFKSEADFNP